MFSTDGLLSQRLDPSASFTTIGVAFVAMMVLAVMLPLNVRRRHRQSTNKKNEGGPNDGRGSGGNGPDLALWSFPPDSPPELRPVLLRPLFQKLLLILFILLVHLCVY